MIRKFIIWFDLVEWEIREEKLSDYKKFKSSEIELFANIRLRDKKIVYLNDISINNNDIKIASKFEIFKEESVFFINDSNFLENCIQNKEISFQGTFIDALEYIKKNFKS